MRDFPTSTARTSDNNNADGITESTSLMSANAMENPGAGDSGMETVERKSGATPQSPDEVGWFVFMKMFIKLEE